MTDFPYRLDESGSVIDPIVGDAEIRAVEFEFPNMRLRVVQPLDGTEIDLPFSDMLFLCFQTDHPQNVIESIFVHNSWESARLPREVDQAVLRKALRSPDRYVVVVRCIAGGPLVCGSCGLNMYVRGSRHAIRDALR